MIEVVIAEAFGELHCMGVLLWEVDAGVLVSILKVSHPSGLRDSSVWFMAVKHPVRGE